MERREFGSAEHLFELVLETLGERMVHGFAVELGEFFEPSRWRAVRLGGVSTIILIS